MKKPTTRASKKTAPKKRSSTMTTINKLKRLLKQQHAALDSGDYVRGLALAEQQESIINDFIDADLKAQPNNHAYHAQINRLRSREAGVRHLKAVNNKKGE